MKKIYIFILLLFSSVGAFAQYVLKASDVTVSSSGLIESCNISDFNKPSYGNGNVVIPESINNITITGIKGHRLGGAFFNKGITGLTLPDGVVSIGVKAFANNTIVSIKVPYGNVSISAGAFQNNALTSVTIPSTTENIFQFAFDGNSALNGITLPVCNSVSGKIFTVWHDTNGKVYNGGETVTDFTVAYRAQFVNSIPYTLTDADVTILNGIITVCSNTNGGTDITIPNTIKNQEVVKIAANVFYGKGVDKVVLPVLDDDFFTGWLSGTGINYAGGAVIKDLTTSYTAQFAMPVIYTLTDSDVTIQYGVIKSCSNVNGANVIRIPEKLQNQDVLGINANVFKDKGVVRLMLPSPTIDNFLHWRSGAGDTYVAGATVNDVLTSYNIEYDQTKPYTLQDKDVVMYGDGILKEVVYNFSCKNIIIPDRLHGMDVKVISEASNFENKGITSLQLPGTLEEIEDYVFTDNEIESLILPEKYFKMGIAVFTNNKISKINGKASDGIIFARKSDGTEDFTTIISYGGPSDIVDFIPNTVININTVAFNGCGITSVKLPKNLLFIGEWAFEGNSINYINLPGTKEWIDNSGIIYPAGSQISNYQKAYTHNVHYTLADSDVVVKEGNIVGFTNTKGATFITIPDKLHGEHIIGVRSGVFANKGVVKLFLPEHNNLPDFRGWTNFIAETIKPINGQYIISNFSAPEIDSKNLNKTYIAKLSSYTLTSMDVEMENNVLKSSVFKFLVNKSIDYSSDPPTFIYDTLDIPRHLIIPDNLDGQSVEHIGREVFMNGGLEKLDLPSSLISTGEYSFASNNIELLTIPANVLTIGEWSFANDYSIAANKGLRRLEFKNGSKLKEINRYAFYGNYKLDQFLYLPDNVKVICDYAFSESGVDFVKFPKTIQEIGKGAFKGCDIRGANYLVFPDDCSIEMIGEEAFADNIPLDADGGIILPKSNINGFIGWRSNQTNEILGAGSKISNLSTSYRAQYEYTLSDDDVEMEDGYIKNYIRDLDKCSSYIVIPDILEGQEVKGIKVRYGYPPGALLGVFNQCRLKKITLPSELEYIPDGCFYSNYLSEVELPDGVVYVGERAFYRNLLKSLTLPDHNTKGFKGWIAHDINSGSESWVNKTGGEYIVSDLFKTSYTAAYEVVFKDYDGSELKRDIVKHYQDATPPADPERTGYIFTGWDKDYTNILEGITLVAQYKKNGVVNYTVTFKDWDGTILSVNTVEEHDCATAPDDPEREGYTFTGWDVSFTDVVSDLVVTAQYMIKTYTVTFVDYDGTVLKTESVDYGNAATAPDDPDREGYVFTGWDVSFTDVVSDLVVTAQYMIKTYTVTFVDYDGTALKTESVDYGSAATAPDNPEREGYTFTGWDVSFTDVMSDLVVTAMYKLKAITDVDNINRREEFCIFPNPVNNVLIINSEPFQNKVYRVLIFDMTGSIVYQYSGFVNNRIDVSNLNRGTYLLHIGNKITKFIKL